MTSIEKKTVLQRFTDVCAGDITAIEVCSDGIRLFVAGDEGHFKLISLTDGKPLKDFGTPHSRINSIVLTRDEKFVFTGCRITGLLKQWSVRDFKLVKDSNKPVGKIVRMIEW